MARRLLPKLGLATGLFVAYCIGGRLGLALAFVNPSATAVWPPAGIALAALLIGGLELWPAVLLGAFLVNFTTSGSVPVSLAIAAGNTLEAIAGCWLVRRFAAGAQAFESGRNVFLFVFLAALLSTLLSATIGVTSLVLGGRAQLSDVGPIWLTWWLGDASGDLIFAPLVVLWA